MVEPWRISASGGRSLIRVSETPGDRSDRVCCIQKIARVRW